MVYLPLWLVIWLVVFVLAALSVSIVLAFKLHWCRWALFQEKQVVAMLQKQVELL